MSESPNATEILRSLRLIRSIDPAERKRGINILGHLQSDPRVMQVFEHLYQNDPDPSVRELAWRAISMRELSLPLANDGMTIPFKVQQAPSSNTLFLLNPANTSFVNHQMKLLSHRRSGGRYFYLMAIIVLFLAGIFAGLALPGWYKWYQLRENSQTVRGIVSLKEDYTVNGERRYFITYRFPADAVEEETGLTGFISKQRVTPRTYDRLQSQEIVAVTFMQDNPNVSRLKNYADLDTQDRALFTNIAGGLVVGVGVLLFLSMVFNRRSLSIRSKRMLRGEIVSCTGLADRDGDFNVKVRYHFRSPVAGITITAHSSQVRNDLKNVALPGPGTPVAIYYKSDQSYRLL
jgi:hypothetical protein